MPYIGRGLTTGAQYQKLDDIAINNATTFTMSVGSANVSPDQNHLILVVNGVIQEPGTGFTVSGSTCTLASAITTSGHSGLDTIYGVIAGDAAYAAYDSIGANALGVTAGTVTASRAIVPDGNKDIASFRNVTLTGELDAATLDISGNADIDGTTNLDAVDIDGAVQIDSTVTVGVDDTGYDVKFFGATASAYMLWDASTDDLVLAGAAGIDLAGDLDVDGTANLDVVDIDGAVDMASTLAVGDTLSVSKTQDGETALTVANVNTGTAGHAEIIVKNANGNVGGIRAHGTGFTTSNFNEQDGFTVESYRQILHLVASNDKDIKFWNGTSNNVTFKNGGNVGIGIAAPVWDLDIGGQTTIFGANLGSDGVLIAPNANNVRLIIEGQVDASIILVDDGASSNDKAMMLQTVDGTTKFRSLAASTAAVKDDILCLDHGTGNVGIGTASPASTQGYTGILEIANASDTALVLHSEVGGTANKWEIGNNTSGVLQFAHSIAGNGSTGTKMVIDGDGNVGIGVTDPTSPAGVDKVLEISGTSAGICLTDSDVDTHWEIYNSSSVLYHYNGAQRLTIAADGTFTGSGSADISDERLKENIAIIPNALESIKKLKGRTFTWKEEADMQKGTKYGLIAQELEEVFPDLVYDECGIRQKEDGTWYKSISTNGVIPVLIEAVKELTAKVEALENA